MIVIIAVVFALKSYVPKKDSGSIVDSSDIIVLNDKRCKECDFSFSLLFR